jgi:hypothetical protein
MQTPLRFGNHVGHALQGLDRQIAGFGSELQGERFQTLAIFREAVDPAAQEFGMGEALVEDVAAHGAEPHDVGAGTCPQVEIGPPRHFIFTQVGDDELLPVQLVGALHARGEHGMALGGVAADDQHQIGLLDIGDGARIAAVADRAEQPVGGRRLAISRAVVDIVGPDTARASFCIRKLLRWCISRRR